MEVIYVDDCIERIYFHNGEILYERGQNIECIINKQQNFIVVNSIPYKIGQIIHVILGDPLGYDARMSMTVYLNEYIIKTESQRFWKCLNCRGGNYAYNSAIKTFDCYGGRSNYDFIFQINNFEELSNSYGDGIEKFPYSYYLTKEKYFFKNIAYIEEEINFIYLNSTNILFIKNGDQIIEPIYELLSFKLYFDNYFPSSFRILGLDESNNNNEIELFGNTLYSISKFKFLRYKLKESEKLKKGVHLKFYMEIFDFNGNSITKVEEFNFFICLNEYEICDADTDMKCLNEGYYFSDNFYYSCYRTCKTCDTYGKPYTADYLNNYCDSCKSEYSYFINTTEEENKFYLSCYRQCPKHAPYLREVINEECVSSCPKYATNAGFCVDNCDYEVYKYLLKNNNTCYSYIPNNYSIYIDNYYEVYDNSNIPIVNIVDECLNDSYDSTFKNYCINLETDIFYLIPDPNDLVEYHDPLIISLETKNITIRAFSSNSQSEELKSYDNKLFRIDISPCEKILREYYNLAKDEQIIIYDVNNLDNENYTYKIFSSKGEELYLNICLINNISLNIISYFSKKGLNPNKCPKEYPYYNILDDKCIKFCDIIHYLEQTCITDYITRENKNNNINRIKNSIKSHLIDSLLNNVTELGEDIIIEEENIKYHLSSTSEQNTKIYENISNIYLGQCENKLKEKYHINMNQSLLIFKVDINIEGYLSPIIEYEVYHPITKEKLDLSYCNQDQIRVSKPVSIDINENDISKYDPKSDFYNDICSTYTNEFNTDMTLKNRQNEFINNNMSLCEENCDFISYNNSLKKVNCKCDAKLTIKDLCEAKIDKDKLKSIFNFKNMINIKVIKCYKKLFCKEGILYNIGSYILLSIILIYIIVLFFFIYKDFKSLQKEIEFFIKFDNNNINNENKIVNDLKKKKIIKRTIKKIKIKKKKKEIKEMKCLDISNQSKGKMILYIINKGQKLDNNNYKIKNDINNNLNINHINTDNNDIVIENKNIVMNDYELNECKFKEALKYDKRTYLEYFFSLLKIEHLLLFAIIPSKDYNSRTIKSCIFLYSFALNLTIEALFYNEETMSNIYEIRGVYDIISQIPQIIYSGIISSFIDIIIKYFSLSQKFVIDEKNKKNGDNNDLKYKKIINNLRKRFIFFYIFSFLFLLFSWYYVSCFCAVYKNTQIHLIKDVLIGFGLSLIFPFISYSISGLFRICGLRYKKKYIYKFSSIIII